MASPTPKGDMFIIWSGTVSSAKLVGDEFNVGARNDIYLNDTFVGQSIIDGAATNGTWCEPRAGSTKEWAIAPSLLRQGFNRVRLTSALQGSGLPDEWGMKNVHLVLQGDDLVATQVVDFTFTSSYDNTSQPAALQAPISYLPTEPTPLLLAIHGWGDNRWAPLNDYGEAANAAGWLLAAPDMHGERSAAPRPPYDHPLASRASQQDILDTIQWVRQRYNVDPNRIYIAGTSMGGQIALVTAAKNPGLFAAVVVDRGPTDLARWYDESEPWRQILIAQEVGGPPGGNLWFEYLRRSPLSFARNFSATPLRLYHATGDTTVLPRHSQDMLNAVPRGQSQRARLTRHLPRQPHHPAAWRQGRADPMAGQLRAAPRPPPPSTPSATRPPRSGGCRSPSRARPRAGAPCRAKSPPTVRSRSRRSTRPAWPRLWT